MPSVTNSSLWFVRVPRRTARRSRLLTETLADGHFLAAVRPRVIAVLATPMAAGAGLLFGAVSLGYDRVYTESLSILLLGCLLGFLSTNLGLSFVAGFAIGDFFVAETRWTVDLLEDDVLAGEGVLAALLRIRMPMLIGYLLLAALCVYIPRIARLLVADIPQTTRLPKAPAFAIASLLNLIVVAIAVRLWAEATAILIRPLFVWQFQSPTIDAISPLQNQAHWLVLAAIAATGARFAILWSTYASDERTRRLLEVERGLAAPDPSGREPKQLPPALAAILGAGLSTLSMSGLIDNWLLTVLAFAVFAIMYLIRSDATPISINWWKKIAARVPVLLRLVLGFLILANLRDSFAGEYDEDFDRLALYLLGSVVMLVALLPGTPRHTAEGGLP